MEREEDKTYNYNTSRPHLILKEYGRNVQMLAEYISNLETTEERTKYAYTLIELMKQLNPSVKDNQDNQQRIWDHLHVMSDFDLEIEGPFPKPSPEIIHKKPEKMVYNQNRLKFRHYGRNIEIMIDSVVEEEDLENQKEGLYQIYSLMRSFYSSFHKENMEAETIIKNIEVLANGRLNVREIIEEDPDYFNQKRPNTKSNSDNKSSSRQSSRQGNNNSRRAQLQPRHTQRKGSNPRNKDNRKQQSGQSSQQRQSPSSSVQKNPRSRSNTNMRPSTAPKPIPQKAATPPAPKVVTPSPQPTPQPSSGSGKVEDKELMRLKQEILERRKREAENPDEY
ncbi:DUF4290 domain-containing protein [Sediminitomix flava]|uniref:Uncharacterized protein DUF4290 n=1 Tax=Sediminitomix flava TaxID=379075 RepID=A0A315ZFZ3_SEDFL|nr:DUF4290 domain-containing protein [Sediminitomix flava]PWJ44069.1 uncharacterized protein DUF4290 [Sediminitomix flava]